MTRDEKIALCRRLKDEGLSVRAIAAKTGIPRATVQDFLAGDEYSREAAKARGIPCSRCGLPRYERHDGLCATCRHDDADLKLRRLEALWLAGARFSEIQRELGWSKGYVSKALARGRELGYDLPYRRHGEALANIRRANQKKAAA